jgi:hypothetical protein
MKLYRPWGHIDWLTGRLGAKGWSLLACASTEERSMGLACHFGRARLDHARIVAIRDPQPLDAAAVDALLAVRKTELRAIAFAEAEIRDARLLGGLDEIRSHVAALTDAGARRLIIDITSFPKLWFFPILQATLEDERVTDVIATYTSAVHYAETLSENMGPLRPLPGFYADDGRTVHDSMIVGIGFEPSPLLPLLQDHRASKIRLIFPFPPGPPGHRRNWMFVKQIEELTEKDVIDPPARVHIHMYDCPQVFDALVEMTRNGQDSAALAPYGPKTVSLAMCLYSLAAAARGRTRVPVFYAQPMRYALNYTTGIARRGDLPEITGYCLRLRGRNLYELA